ncbi:hypothetical protein DFQ27_008760 [Actinomortierella ambigua]|uniref:Sel1 repeat family protein n=1 Tax=Actinomortierella ambigua TaxID=1343610 RepID=A0A9P6TYH2_9FUNG|nr:hypothetical protein DFQ27_008760 [Actinomortierella ambigua]
MYAHGLGVKQDYAEAMILLRKSVEQGSTCGQHILGEMYEYGRGVDRDIPQAIEWYSKAAEKGDEDARKRMEKLGTFITASTLQVLDILTVIVQFTESKVHILSGNVIRKK